MTIRVNKNVDEYRDDFWKGLSLAQTGILLLALLAGVGGFLLGYYVLLLPVNVSLYCAFPTAFPVAAMLLRHHGMSPLEWVQKKRKLKETPCYLYCPMYPDALREDEKRQDREAHQKTALYLGFAEEEQS